MTVSVMKCSDAYVPTTGADTSYVSDGRLTSRVQITTNQSLPRESATEKPSPRGPPFRVIRLAALLLLLVVAACFISQGLATFRITTFRVASFSISPDHAVRRLSDYANSEDKKPISNSLLEYEILVRTEPVSNASNKNVSSPAGLPTPVVTPSRQVPPQSSSVQSRAAHSTPSLQAAERIGNRHVAGRFYMVIGGGDYCVGESHWTWSFLCAAAEAKALNRTLVVPDLRCISKEHSLTGKKEEKPLGLYYNMEHMMSRQPMIFSTTFRQRFGSLDPEKLQQRGRMRVAEYKPFAATAWVREKTRDVQLVVRRLKEEQFVYQICKVPENKKLLKRDLELLWRPKALAKLSKTISASMGWNYDAVHVRRGDKVNPSNRKYWPNLDRDTRPKALLKTLPKFIKPGRHVYIASNERTPGFFSPLASLYKIHVLSDYRHLWAPGSKFRKDLKALLRSLNVTTVKPELDAYMEWTVELTVLGNAKKRVETFNDLTSDSKNAMIRNNKTRAS